MDPWSLEGSALARFEQLKDLAAKAVIAERQAHEVLVPLNKQILRQSLA
ncbi:hypothetical protein [Salinisphaera sp. G21_0]|nr:hypothetical protein [Salinisphaera sp. G21_0]MBO9482449.1 hypothetical protein [Salinisphaera sp. G21_0]